MRYQTGDVVWGPDPYHSGDPWLEWGRGRPWLIISTRHYPRQGHDYVCCALTSSPRPDPFCIPLLRSDWDLGRPPRRSKLDPQTLLVLKHRWFEARVGRLREETVRRAQDCVRGYF